MNRLAPDATDLVGCWIRTHFPSAHVLVAFDVMEDRNERWCDAVGPDHVFYLAETEAHEHSGGLPDVWFAVFESYEKANEAMKKYCDEAGDPPAPYVQLWSLGDLLSENT